MRRDGGIRSEGTVDGEDPVVVLVLGIRDGSCRGGVDGANGYRYNVRGDRFAVWSVTVVPDNPTGIDVSFVFDPTCVRNT